MIRTVNIKVIGTVFYKYQTIIKNSQMKAE